MISRFFSWGIFGVVLMVMAVVHFVRRQPSFYWLYLIIFLGPLGALIYLAIEWLPELFDPGAFRFVEPQSGKIHRQEIMKNSACSGWIKPTGAVPAPVLTAHWRSAPIRLTPFTAAASPRSS